MKAILYRAVVLCAALLASSSFAQDVNPAKVRIKTEKLSDTTYLLVGEGGNIGLSIGADGVFLVDDQFAPLTPKIKAAIAKLNKKPVKFVLNTHWHFDHTGGNENFGRGGAVIVAHENARRRLSTAQFVEFFGMWRGPEPETALPVVTFTRDLKFHINGEEVQVLHIPNAHTDGDVIVYFGKSNVLHTGDLFFNKLYPFIDTAGGGSIEGVIAGVDRMLEMANDDTKIIPGHGSLATKTDLKAYREMLATVAQRVKTAMQEDKSLEAVVAAKPTAEFDAMWGKGFLPPVKFVTMIYGDLKK